jgi:hypothetical protein
MKNNFRDPFRNTEDLREWINKYLELQTKDNKKLETKLISNIAPAVRERRFWRPEELKILCDWKAGGRTGHLCEDNSEEFIKEVTRTSYTTNNEQLRITILTLLKGVRERTASAMLHFIFNDIYPILDVWAIQAIGIEEAFEKWYSFENWIAYVEFCKKKSNCYNVSMRELDMALWAKGKDAGILIK